MTDTDNPFKQFEGIDDARNVRVRDKTIQEKLIEIGVDVVNYYLPNIWKNIESYSDAYRFTSPSGKSLTNARFRYKEMGVEAREDVYALLEKHLLNGVDFNESDLAGYIMSMSNTDYIKTQSESLGMFTGGLLHILTKRNRAQGKRTRFYINGNGNRFDYLFYYAGKIDQVIVDGFVGEHICAWAGAYSSGQADTIVLMNCKGNEALSFVCNETGYLKNVIVINHEGDSVASKLGDYNYNRGVTNLGLFYIKGEDAASHATLNYDHGKLLLHAVGGNKVAHNSRIQTTIRGEEALKEGRKIIQHSGLGNIVKL